MINLKEDKMFVAFIALALAFGIILVGGFTQPIKYSPSPSPQSLGLSVPGSSNPNPPNPASPVTPPQSISTPVTLPPVGTSGWVCTGLTGTTKMTDGYYNSTYFGCGATGQLGEDPNDNCLPACNVSSLCTGSGPSCEGQIKWFAADSDRYSCMSRLKLTNPKNNKSVIVVSIDRGPNCSVEQSVNRGILDMSQPAYNYLGIQDSSDLVYVQDVSSDTPLGPVQ